jgi:bleomycin hydrolase
MKYTNFLMAISFVFAANAGQSQDSTISESYNFTTKIELEYTPVKDQFKSGTCWSFATVSFLESELLRIGEGKHDLSEMFFVHHAYVKKAERYVRYHGTSNFGPGGQAHDVIDVMREFGVVDQDNYPGLYKGEQKHDHGELDAVLAGFLKSVISNKGGKLSPVWPVAYKSILNSYLGVIPDDKVVADLKTKPAISNTLGLNPDDYVEITSYLHHPFYSSFVLEIPDNWSASNYYNVPLEDFIRIIRNSLESGYTVCWDGDVSDRGFSHKNGLAIIPEMQPVSSAGTEMSKWEEMSEKERSDFIYNFKEVRAEKLITQEMRQEAFNNLQATDDHLMHLVGIVKDQTGKDYFITKNSWSDKSNDKGGILIMSESFLRLNTIAIMVHKDAVPKDIKIKLNL